MQPTTRFIAGTLAVVALLASAPLLIAAVLPEERADLLYHRYDGGGVVVDGPSLLVRKNFAETVSVSFKHYVDNVSSASIDVVTTASPDGYTETRTENSIGVDYLYDRTLLSASYTHSDENDYTAQTYSFDIGQDFFGDLSNISIGFSLGDDEVRRNGDDTFSEQVERRHYRVGLTQILTRNLLISAKYEAITDEGYLNNPYRSVRYLTGGGTYAFQPELYPNTRTSDTFSLSAIHYLPYRAALKAEYRNYRDDWDIKADSFEISYTHPFRQHWIFDVRLRHYSQDKAEFYSDLFPFQDAQNYLARDKELSTFTSMTYGVGVSYQFSWSGAPWIDKASINFNWDRMQFDYDDFRDISSGSAGEEPLYSFDADVIRLFFSAWY